MKRPHESVEKSEQDHEIIKKSNESKFKAIRNARMPKENNHLVNDYLKSIKESLKHQLEMIVRSEY